MWPETPFGQTDDVLEMMNDLAGRFRSFSLDRRDEWQSCGGPWRASLRPNTCTDYRHLCYAGSAEDAVKTLYQWCVELDKVKSRPLT